MNEAIVKWSGSAIEDPVDVDLIGLGHVSWRVRSTPFRRDDAGAGLTRTGERIGHQEVYAVRQHMSPSQLAGDNDNAMGGDRIDQEHRLSAILDPSVIIAAILCAAIELMPALVPLAVGFQRLMEAWPIIVLQMNRNPLAQDRSRPFMFSLQSFSWKAGHSAANKSFLYQ
jgi:hypothetical protein